MSSDLTFITNESSETLRDRFGVLLGDDTRFFDCLVGYFFISGFHKLHPALAKTERIRILTGIKTDRVTYELIQTARKQQEFALDSHAQVRERVPGEILGELQESGDSSDIEDGVRKFVEWIKSGKLEVRKYPSERLHAKLYIMTFHEGDRDKGRVVTGSSIPWNPTRLIQRVGRVNRVDTKFDTIHTYNFFPTDEGNGLIKLREAAEAKIHAFIQMLGADARLLTEGEEIVSHDLFAKWNSKKTITGEDEEEETELKYLTEIRTVRDEQIDLFERIKRLPKKARSSRVLAPDPVVPTFPALLTYFRQGKVDKFFLGAGGSRPAVELDFMSAAKVLKPADPAEPRQPIPRGFYDLLDRNKAAFVAATTAEAEQAESTHRGSPSDAYILKRLKDKAIRRCPQFTEDDEEFVGRVIRLLDEGSLPKATAKKVAASLKKEDEPLKVLNILRRHVKREFFQVSPAAHASQALAPREVILSAWIIRRNGEGGGHE